MRPLLIATTNPDKLREIGAILGHLPLEIVTLRDVAPVPEPEETGVTFAENARLKALHYDAVAATDPAPHAGLHGGDPATIRARYTIAEDSGLVIDALDGEPGVHSARFLRPDASYPERFAEIYRRLNEAPARGRSARFVCALALVTQGTVIYETTGTIEGEIASSPSGVGGFGYDPIFHYPPYGCTLGDVTEEAKLRVAHRGEAFRRLATWLEENI
jgi:XTP/dITP diphosphohydrolase